MVKVSTYPATTSGERNSELELLMIHDQPIHLWLDGEHYIQSKNRRATAGKVYYSLQPNQLLRVVDVIPMDNPVTKHSVNDAEATIVVEYLYELAGGPEKVEYERKYDIEGTSYEPGLEYGPNSEYTVSGQVEGVVRYQMESSKALTKGDRPMVPFESTVNETSGETTANKENVQLDEVDKNQQRMEEY